MVARTFGMYSLGDIGINAGNYNFSTLATGGTFTASATAAPTLVTLDDTDSQNNIFNDGAPGNFAAAPTLQRLTGNVEGTVFTNVPSNPENEFQVRDSGGNIVGSIFTMRTRLHFPLCRVTLPPLRSCRARRIPLRGYRRWFRPTIRISSRVSLQIR